MSEKAAHPGGLFICCALLGMTVPLPLEFSGTHRHNFRSTLAYIRIKAEMFRFLP